MKKVCLLPTVYCLLLLVGCVEEPVKEDVPELITKITLTFTPDVGALVMVSAADPDGEGVKSILPDGIILLDKDRSYTLTLGLINELADPSSPEYNLTSEIEKEGDEHLFFFNWTNNLFSSPSGNGNIDNRNDDLNYGDKDVAGLPIGIKTYWIASATPTVGEFRILLKHQPGIKSLTSSATAGETDLDLIFSVEIK